MYLGTLNNEEKELFLGLAFHLACADGDYSEEEREMMQAYCHEMQVVFDQSKVLKSIDQILNAIKQTCGNKVRKIIIFEVIGLVMADGKYDEAERVLISRMESEFGVESGFAEKCEDILKEYISFQKRINEFVLG